jgi:hypothetical protein
MDRSLQEDRERGTMSLMALSQVGDCVHLAGDGGEAELQPIL